MVFASVLIAGMGLVAASISAYFVFQTWNQTTGATILYERTDDFSSPPRSSHRSRIELKHASIGSLRTLRLVMKGDVRPSSVVLTISTDADPGADASVDEPGGIILARKTLAEIRALGLGQTSYEETGDGGVLRWQVRSDFPHKCYIWLENRSAHAFEGSISAAYIEKPTGWTTRRLVKDHEPP